MAARINLRQQEQTRAFYVYRLFDGLETVYIGKGSGRRLAHQKRRFGCDGEVIEWCRSDDHAFAREVYWITQLCPSENKVAGGNGGRCRPKPKARRPRIYAEMERIGTRRYAAQFLLTRVDERNCGEFGISPERVAAIRNVANGLAIL